MKYMGVDTYECGFRKLWKIISSLDHIISKMTELEIIQLLKYDEIFDELAKDS
jgi:ribosomal protein L19E